MAPGVPEYPTRIGPRPGIFESCAWYNRFALSGKKMCSYCGTYARVCLRIPLAAQYAFILAPVFLGGNDLEYWGVRQFCKW